MRAAVADLVPVAHRGSAYGVFAAGYGAATLAGGALTGIIYGASTTALIVVVALLQTIALAMLAEVLAVYRRQSAR